MAKTSDKAQKRNIFKRISDYFAGVVTEFKRVVWPSRPEVLNSSIVVIITLIFFVAFTFLVDQAAVNVVSFIAGLGG
ncbi:MAG: preprotein translocase subunit SecE [Actinobacteria bacterium]|nr:preprotein translocase subunit SecE [Actinomycetota bacterium]MCL5886917.1 preprotein translocase subunit SecE [Actinomycetota bacterium]MCL5886919.1 preprotein translocase subunit SecE [Actinomycetota bacterium]